MANYEKKALGIKAWAEEDRPREKLQLKGKFSLSNAELLAILIGSGSREETAVGLAQRILLSKQNNLNELGKCNLAELKEFKGIGLAKAITIIAALELGRRRKEEALPIRNQIKSSRDAYRELAPKVADLPHEEFWLLMLNRANRIMHLGKVSSGGVVGTVVDARIVFKDALDHRATTLILCHNHPSGNLQPSQADIDLTRKLKQAGEVMDIAVVDHLIISDQGYFSFADEGMI